MAHVHFSDAELARFATEPDAIALERRNTIEREAASCATCRTSLDFFSVITMDDLADVEKWETANDWSANDPMRAYVERIGAENREADAVLEEMKLFESPTETAFKNLQRQKQLLTGGVVRRLTARAHDLHLDEALEALTFADAAISIVEMLPDDLYPWKAVYEMRGEAWKERANALLVHGDYPGALDALKHAERAYGKLKSPGFGLSTVALVRASVLYEQGRLDEADASAERAESGFGHLGEDERAMRARFLRASIRYEAGDVANAVELFRRVLEHCENRNNAEWAGRAMYALGNCEVERGDLNEASIRFHRALMTLRETGPERECIKAEWGLARVVLHSGNVSGAISRLRNVAAEMERRSFVSDAALVRLDIVDGLLALDQTNEIVELCARLFRVFRNADMLSPALTAIAYMKEAAASGKLTRVLVNAVRTYLRRLERQPELVFVPPAE